jgi:membrane protease YdiL (CAAX protease family)
VAAAFLVGYMIYKQSLDLQWLMSLTSNGLMVSLTTIISVIAGIGFVYLFIKLRKGISVAEYLELKPLSRKTMLTVLAVMLGLLAVSFGLDRFVDSSQNNAFMIGTYLTAGWTPLLWIATVVFAPLFEEVFFRGFIFVGLRHSRLGVIGTIILTSVAWASLHAIQYDIYGIASVFVLGLAFGIIRQKTGSLWSTLVLHSLWNLIAMIQTALFIHGIG